MRHGQKGYKLGRTHAHRKATLAALSTALIKHKRIRTTLTKAKALRTYVEPLITRSKDDTTHNRRQVFRYLQDKYAVTELFSEVSDKVGDRNGGYTRIVKLGQRGGDGSEMAIIELVDFNDSEPSGGKTRRSGRTRRGGGKGRRRGGAKKTTQATGAAATTTAVETEDQILAPDDEMEGVQTETVEEPVAEEVATPVTARTDDTPEGVEAEAVEAEVEEAADEPAAEAEIETVSEEAEAEAEVEAPEPEAADESAAEADVETAPEETEAATDEPEAEAATEQPQAEADHSDDATDEDKKEE